MGWGGGVFGSQRCKRFSTSSTPQGSDFPIHLSPQSGTGDGPAEAEQGDNCVFTTFSSISFLCWEPVGGMRLTPPIGCGRRREDGASADARKAQQWGFFCFVLVLFQSAAGKTSNFIAATGHISLQRLKNVHFCLFVLLCHPAPKF